MEDPVVQALIDNILENLPDGAVLTDYSYDVETGEFNYSVVYPKPGSGEGDGEDVIGNLQDAVEDALKEQGVEDFVIGSGQVTDIEDITKTHADNR